MAEESRRGYLAILGAILLGGVLRFADDAAKLIDELRYLIIGADDAGEAVRDWDPNDSSDAEDGYLNSTTGTITLDCTDAYIENFEWNSTFETADEITADVINQGDIAGSVELVLEFYTDENKTIILRKEYKTVAIAAQDTQSIQFNVEPPEDANYAVLSVNEQDCDTDDW